jgi:hypothetical protein
MGQQIFNEADFDSVITTETPTEAPVQTATTVSPSQVAAAVAEPVEEVPVPTADAIPDPDEAPVEPELPLEEDKTQPVVAKKTKGPQARINEAIRKQRDAEREAAYWRAQAQTAPAPASSSLSTTAQAPSDPSDPEPVIESFMDQPDPWLALTKASARWAARQETKLLQSSQQQQAAMTRHSQDMQRLLTTLPNATELKQLADEMPGPHPELRHAILSSDVSARLVLYFAEHPEDYDYLQRQSGPTLVRALGQIEGRLSTAQSGPVAQARVTTPVITPIKPVGSAPVSTTPAPDDLEFGPEYIRAMNARDRERRKNRF